MQRERERDREREGPDHRHRLSRAGNGLRPEERLVLLLAPHRRRIGRQRESERESERERELVPVQLVRWGGILVAE